MGSATVAALLLQRTGAGVGHGTGQRSAASEHVAKIRRRGTQASFAFETGEDRVGLRGAARRLHVRQRSCRRRRCDIATSPRSAPQETRKPRVGGAFSAMQAPIQPTTLKSCLRLWSSVSRSP
jgi:hypothetical protein